MASQVGGTVLAAGAERPVARAIALTTRVFGSGKALAIWLHADKLIGQTGGIFYH